jgi:hypothetical protein
MKRIFTRAIPACCLALSLLIHAAAAGSEDPNDNEKKEARKAARVSVSRNNSSVKIFPGMFRKVMHVVARDDRGIEFFVFGSDGALVKHYKMKSGDHEKLVGLRRGSYSFRVFAGDEETATGNFAIR